MSTEWTIGIIITVALGTPSLYWGWHAHKRSVREDKAKAAHRQAEEAERAKVEARREQVRLAQEDRQRDLNRARFTVEASKRTSGGQLRIQIINRGPHLAREVVAALVIGGRVFRLGSTSALVENGQMPVFAELGSIAGRYTTGPDNTEVVHPSVKGDLTISFVDGNGPQTLRKRLNIGSGSRFEQRQIAIADAD